MAPHKPTLYMISLDDAKFNQHTLFLLDTRNLEFPNATLTAKIFDSEDLTSSDFSPPGLSLLGRGCRTLSLNDSRYGMRI